MSCRCRGTAAASPRTLSESPPAPLCASGSRKTQRSSCPRRAFFQAACAGRRSRAGKSHRTKNSTGQSPRSTARSPPRSSRARRRRESRSSTAARDELVAGVGDAGRARVGDDGDAPCRPPARWMNHFALPYSLNLWLALTSLLPRMLEARRAAPSLRRVSSAAMMSAVGQDLAPRAGTRRASCRWASPRYKGCRWSSARPYVSSSVSYLFRC